MMKKKVKEGDEMLPKYLVRIRNPKSRRVGLPQPSKYLKEMIDIVNKESENPFERIYEPPCAYCGRKNPEFCVKYPVTPDLDPILYLTHRFYTGDVPVCSSASCQAQLKKEIREFEELKRSLKKGEKRGKVHRDKIKEGGWRTAKLPSPIHLKKGDYQIVPELPKRGDKE